MNRWVLQLGVQSIERINVPETVSVDAGDALGGSPRLALRPRPSTSGRTILRRKAGEGRRGEDPKSDFGPSGSRS